MDPLNTTKTDAAASAAPPTSTVRASLDMADADDYFEMKAKKPGRTINFAEKMHLVLSNKECQEAITWLPSGRSFCITSKDKFVNTILPKYFKSRANFNSFERRLKTWGFSKIDASSKVYVFTHEDFKRAGPSRAELEESAEDNFNTRRQLRTLLSNAEFAGFIWWHPCRDAFCVASTSELTSKILFQYFGETQFKRFVETLKRDGFKRISTGEYFGEAIYSHELFRMGRPDLCSRMCRGGNGSNRFSASIADAQGAALGPNSLTDSFFLPNALGGLGAAGLSTIQGGMHPMMAAQGTNSAMMQQSSMNMNFPIPLNNSVANQLPHGMVAAAAAGGSNGALLNSAYSDPNLFAFNRVGSSSSSTNSQTMSDLQVKQLAQANLNHRESLLMRQSQLLNGESISPTVFQQQQQQQSLGAEQQIMNNIMMGRRHSLLTTSNNKSEMNDNGSSVSEGALMNRRNSAPVRDASAPGNANDVAQMSLLEVEDELLRVKELKLLMMKRKLERQLEQNNE